MVDQETGKTGVGEADVELAEVAAFEQRQAARIHGVAGGDDPSR